jgi:hypothetical protein
VRDQLEILATERMALAGSEIGEGHLVRAPHSRIHMVHLAGEAVWRQPLDHRVGVNECSVEPLRRRTEDQMELNSVWHDLSLSGTSVPFSLIVD